MSAGPWAITTFPTGPAASEGDSGPRTRSAIIANLIRAPPCRMISRANDPPEEVPSQAVVGEASRRHPLAWSSAFGYHSSAGFWASAPAPAPSLTNSLRSLRDLGWVREAEDEGTYGDLDHAMTTLELNSFTQGYGRQGPHP